MAETESKQNKSSINNRRIFKNNAERATKIFWADIIYYFHFGVVFLVVGLFFVPLSYLPNRIMIHFYILWGIIGLQLLTGLLYMNRINKFRFVCPLTVAEKNLVKKHPHKHIGDSCIGEFCTEKLGLPKWIGTISVLLSLVIVTAQYFKTIGLY